MPRAAAIAPSGATAGEKKMNSRQVLLNSACALMTERSTIDISLSEIAKHSGLNSALIKYYFGDKQGMLLALVEDILAQSMVRLDQLVDMKMSAADKIRLHVQAIITIYFRYPFINRLFHYLFADPESGKVVATRISKPLARTQRILLEEGIATGEFKAIDPMMFFFIILGACDHIFMGQHIMRIAFDVDKIDDDIRRLYTKTLLELILNGLLRKENG
ncbi:TetR family transcriptional regulator (plasmid) [Sphingobium sp. JS3065]|uniref:TetR family transcriptional regulator n=1 Tax=Sphingobium sp. JS3065 TaxID=2970925 RepID=UPI002264CBDF|nr:TetR family transcriptional regulator [Sphingobium sp. JS3065]UZW58290.1 TetR family transcriptional regulator [Sphingobium sp. JS3065]